MKKRRITAIVFGILALGWIYVLFFLSGQNGADSGALSLKLARWIVKRFPGLGMGPADLEPTLRKLAHFGIFAVEGFLSGVSLICALGCAKGALLSAMLCIPMAAANELHQLFSAGRACEVKDMLIDSGGALTGIVAAMAITAVFSLIFRPKAQKCITDGPATARQRQNKQDR